VNKHDAAVVFDLDGTLVDSVYQHVMAWHEALRKSNIELSIWRIHRRIGMSGGLLVRALARELGYELDAATLERLQRDHEAAYRERSKTVVPLPGAIELLATLSREGVAWAIATSAARRFTESSLAALNVPDGVPVVTHDEVAHAKPNPDLFLAAARALDVPTEQTFVVGDSLWDILAARRAGTLGVGLLSGGYGHAELVESGAYRVYEDPADLLANLHELGLRVPRDP
jgi:HAD superfamily hydrolase (TIGR01509 family)